MDVERRRTLVVRAGNVAVNATLALFACSAALTMFIGVRLLRQKHQRTATYEAMRHVEALSLQSARYFEEHGALPASTGPSPVSISDRRQVTVDWSDNATWSALDFAITEPHDFQYRYESSGVGAGTRFTASAFGDLDGDGVLSTFVMFGWVESGSVHQSSVWIANQME